MLVVLLAGQFMALLDVTIVNVAMPTIGRSPHASGAELQLVVAGYTVSYAMLLITGARLGDLAGRRRMFLLGAGTFTLASLACGLAPDIGALIVARFVQGAGTATATGVRLDSTSCLLARWCRSPMSSGERLRIAPSGRHRVN